MQNRNESRLCCELEPITDDAYGSYAILAGLWFCDTRWKGVPLQAAGASATGLLAGSMVVAVTIFGGTQKREYSRHPH